MGPPRRRAQQGRHLQPGARPPALRYPRQRDGQQRRGHGAEAALVLAEARPPLLVGGRGAGQCRGARGAEAQGLDPQGVDAGDERNRTALMAVVRPRGIWKDGAPLVDNGWITNRTGEAERRGEIGRFGETTRGGRRMVVCLVPGAPFYSFLFCSSFAVDVLVGFLFAVHFASGRCLFESLCVCGCFFICRFSDGRRVVLPTGNGWKGESEMERGLSGFWSVHLSDSTGSALVWHSN